jgi:thymidylate synthase (FAD)
MDNYILREEVLDYGFVELIDIMPREEIFVPCEVCNGLGTGWSENELTDCPICLGTCGDNYPRDIAIVNAARTSYLGESKGLESDKKLLRYLYKNKHTSVFEQVEFKFRIKGPILYWWQQIRHRTWSYNLQSGRYTEYADEFYIPDKWRLQDEKNKQGSKEEYIEYADILYNEYDGTTKPHHISSMFARMAERSLEVYDGLLKSGVAKEQARLVLPAFALYHVGIAKVDAKNLLDFLRLRNDDHAQFEIRQYAIAIEKMFAEMLPLTYELYLEEKNAKNI